MDQIAPAISARSLQGRNARTGGTNTVRNIFIVAVAYYLGAEIAFLIGTLSDRIFAPFWPPNIVLFCALLVTPPRQWWIYIAAALPAHTLAELGVGMPMPQLLVAFVTNVSVAIFNAFAVQRLLVEPPWFGSIRKTIIYVLVTAFLGPIDDYGLYWARWYAANALGSLTLGPISMICLESTTRPRLAPTGRAVEALIISVLLISACIFAF
jgi:integral membrane sensor domain MASE1